jgi:hypothetical protein
MSTIRGEFPPIGWMDSIGPSFSSAFYWKTDAQPVCIVNALQPYLELKSGDD